MHVKSPIRSAFRFAVAIVVAGCAGKVQPDRPFVPGDPSYDMIPSIPAAPPRDPNRIGTTWQEELRGTQGVHIFARNDRERPVRMTKLTISTCINVEGGCREWDPDLVLQPGEKRRIHTIVPHNPREGFRFQWNASGRELVPDASGNPRMPESAGVIDMRGWVFVGSDSAELTVRGSCRPSPAPATGAVCDSTPAELVQQRVTARRLVIAPGGEFRIRYGTRPGPVQIQPAPAGYMLDGNELRYRAPRERGVYRYTIDAGWRDRSGSRSDFELVVR